MSRQFNDDSSGNRKKDNDFFHGFDSQKGGIGPFGPGKKKNSIALIFFVTLIAVLLISLFSGGTQATEVSYTTFLDYLDQGMVSTAVIKNEQRIEFTISGSSYNGTAVKGVTRIPYPDSNLLQKLEDKGVNVMGADADVSILSLILQMVPWVIFIFLAVSLIKQTRGNGQLMNYGKSNAKEYTDTDIKITFDDVAGQKEAKYELQEIVDFLKNPAKFKDVGARMPRGVLLVGPPGTGKTLLARAVAGEAKVSFFHTSGSDFVEMFVGMGAARVRDLFEQGRKHAPCIIFIDELDAVGRSRGSGLGGGHDEREQTLNQMLVEMDGFSPDLGVIVMAATNRPDVLDPALLRPGRFDRQVTVDLPDIKEREDILKIHCRKVKLDSDVDLSKVARATPGASGADLANIVNEAALYAAREGKRTVSMNNFEEARDKVAFGVARKSRVMTPEEKTATAYHEAGHTLLYYYLKHLDPLHKVTIIPHGRALGMTMSLPINDTTTLTRSRLEDHIKVCMGGYVAEELVYGETTTGTSNDIKQATDIARRMVTEWGMSEIGFISYGEEDEPLFLGRSIAQHKDYSEDTARRIDEEINKIIKKSMAEVKDILSEHRDQLDKLTQELVAKETLDDSQVRELLGFPQVENPAEI
ncbi:MAG: ATP-dependent zinc metalloprotease FtsH [Sphaerochaetaceae bacterium]|nr:ATP-dependent zinc metalloprotease FtsH [Sphaerochaetaceae bacterium]MDD4007739.1 ATP-dependent zinc metalloprotease FtsH [Sphaerochaetaceae bacterium]